MAPCCEASSRPAPPQKTLLSCRRCHPSVRVRLKENDVRPEAHMRCHTKDSFYIDSEKRDPQLGTILQNLGIFESRKPVTMPVAYQYDQDSDYDAVVSSRNCSGILRLPCCSVTVCPDSKTDCNSEFMQWAQVTPLPEHVCHSLQYDLPTCVTPGGVRVKLRLLAEAESRPPVLCPYVLCRRTKDAPLSQKQAFESQNCRNIARALHRLFWRWER